MDLFVFLGLIMIDGIICIIQRIKIIRMFGVSIPVILIIGLVGSMFIGKFFLYLIICSVAAHIRNKKGLQPEKIYSKWRRGDKVFELIYKED